MANLTVAKPREYTELPSNQRYYTIASTTQLLQGSALSDVSSTAPGVAGTNVVANLTAGENFVGFAEETNVLGSTKINVRHEGRVTLVVTGLLATSLGASVYASDGNTFTQTATSNSYVGKVVEILSLTALTAVVEFKGNSAPNANNVGFTGGAAGDLTHFTFVNGICTAAS